MISVQIYHTKTLPRDMSLSEDPYGKNGGRPDFERLGIVFWRDSEHAYGILSGVFDGPKEIKYSHLLFNEVDLCVDEWSDEAVEQHNIVTKDGRTWLIRNKDVNVSSITRTEISFVKKDVTNGAG